MSELHFPDLHIQGFRGIKDLAIPHLGRVTLITGKNNTGKSSFLEALRLHTENASPWTIYSILAFREEQFRGINEADFSHDPESMLSISSLFHGFPQYLEDFGTIVISTRSVSRLLELKMRVASFIERPDSDGNRTLITGQLPLLSVNESTLALVTNTGQGEQVWPLDGLFQYTHGRRPSVSRASERARMPCIVVSSYGRESTAMLGPLWDEVSLTEHEKDVIEALRIIDSSISAISMIGGAGASRERRAIVRSDRILRPVPLRSFGDGMNRLFAIILSLVNARGGLLLIDEFENGLHYTVQLDAWRMVFQLAQKLNVQVFATSHSKDTIKAFQKAAHESPEEGMYLRLSRWQGSVIKVAWGEEELAAAIDSRIEMR